MVTASVAYVAISRAASEVRIYTDSTAELGEKFSRHSSKTQALDFGAAKAKEQFVGFGVSQ